MIIEFHPPYFVQGRQSLDQARATSSLEIPKPAFYVVPMLDFLQPNHNGKSGSVPL